MSLLRLYGSLREAPERCQWALLAEGREPVRGEGTLAEVPRLAARVQLVLPAAQVLIVRARLPRGAARRAGPLLSFALEERTAADPEASQVSWLGAAGGDDVLAAADKAGLERWRAALGAAGLRDYEVHCETLLLPWTAGEWSLAWNGREGFVRTGELEGAATDCGDRAVPPLCLRLMLEEAAARQARPSAIALHVTGQAAAPDAQAWARELGVAVRLAGTGDWRSWLPGTGVSLAQPRRRWGALAGSAPRLRPAAWLLAAALGVHGVALLADWASLAAEQRALRAQMESRFRQAFPDAVAVVDAPLQMRRKLAEARHAAGQSDGGDFLPMLEALAAGTKDLPAGGLRILSYEAGRMTVQLAAADPAALQRARARLGEAGLVVDAGGKNLITVRAP